ncbi:MAG: phosphotransferase, partial [Acidimicrobiia bacterium]
RPVLVHGDYRPANLLVAEGRLEVLLDWELAHLGDPIEDVGWYCTPIYGREHFIPGRWELADFLRCYRERSGITVDPDRLRFWQTLAAYKLAALGLAAVRIFCDGDSTRPPSAVGPVIAAVLRTIGPPPAPGGR